MRVWFLMTRSCCVKVVNQERTIYVLPRSHKLATLRDETSATAEEVTPVMVHQELTAMFTSRDIKGFKLKQVTKKFCFDQIGDLYVSFSFTIATFTYWAALVDACCV